MNHVFPRPTGEVQGDDRTLEMKGTGTGFSAVPLHDEQQAVSLEGDACNCMGGIGRYTKSDKGEQV